ncbi:MAG: MurR/RpiR family transcriptional regulator [Tistlia sp.]|uniref:MurR/RpiR family transcriptional regulator n=1 Tax=Tistlia sp. TaxID=3057121 RepID=UPI0034A219D5
MEVDRDRSLAGALKAAYAELGKQEKSVARAILKDYPVSALSTVAALADSAGVSTATVLRLVNRLGHETYGQFQEAVKRDLNTLLQGPSDRFDPAPGAPGSFAQATFAQVGGNLKEGARGVLEADFQDVVELLADPRRTTYCIGGRYSRYVAGLFADYLGVLRDKVHLADGQPDGWSRLLVDMDSRSTVVVFDIRRYQRTVRRFAALAKQRGARLVVVTDVWADRATFEADYTFQLPTASPSLMDSFAAPLVLAESLIGALAIRLKDSLKERLALCEELDCVETNLNLAWPGIPKDGPLEHALTHDPLARSTKKDET